MFLIISVRNYVYDKEKRLISGVASGIFFGTAAIFI